MSEITGHCLCGSVTYRTTAEPMLVGICHCTDCQRQSGAPFSLNVGVDLSELTIEGDTLTEYETVGEDTGEPRRRLFCGRCGSPIASILAEASDVAFLKAGTIDDPSGLLPELEVYTESAQPWVHTADADERGLFPRGLPT